MKQKAETNLLSALEVLQQQQAKLLNEMRSGQVGVGTDSQIRNYQPNNLSNTFNNTPVHFEKEFNKPDNYQLNLKSSQDDISDDFLPMANRQKSIENTNDAFYYSSKENPFPKFNFFESFKDNKNKKEKRAKREEKQKSRIKNAISATVFYSVIIFILLGAFLISQGEKIPIMNYSLMNVLTWSMESEIPQGSLIAIKKVDPNTIKIGDDITYMKDAETAITHRVISITENYADSGERGFETKGIENETPDFEIVPAVNVVGVVKFHVPKIGGWLEWLRENLVITLLFTIGFVIMMVLIKGAFKKDPEEMKKSQPRMIKSV